MRLRKKKKKWKLLSLLIACLVLCSVQLQHCHLVIVEFLIDALFIVINVMESNPNEDAFVPPGNVDPVKNLNLKSFTDK